MRRALTSACYTASVHSLLQKRTPLRAIRIAFACVLLSVSAWCPARAQELNVLGGFMHNDRTRDNSYAYELEYLQPVGKHAALSIAYLNEGHPPLEKRDGFPVRLWASTTARHGRLRLAAGAGPYLSFDTMALNDDGRGFIDRHTLAAIGSLDAAWQTGGRWALHLRGNWINAANEMDVLTVEMGLGYSLAPAACVAAGPGQPGEAPTEDGQVTLLGGIDILNTYRTCESSAVEALEYRHTMGRHSEWTVGVVHEDNARLARQFGLTAQIWLVRPLLGPQWTGGIGGGGYLLLSEEDDPSPRAKGAQTLSGLVSVTAARRIGPHWLARFVWNRMVTNDDRDCDMLMLGLGYDLKGTTF